MLKTSLQPASGLHAAIIMDGNGRWAEHRGLPRLAGHRRGAEAIRRAVEAAPDCGIETLTLYAFSSDNWKRPAEEVSGLMSLFGRYLESEVNELMRNGVRLTVIGRRDRLPRSLVRLVERDERRTAHGSRLHLRLAVDYSSRDMILRAAAATAEAEDREGLARRLGPDVDLLIRTGGERRLSDFLLWECAYAELHFLDTLWPDFGAGDLAAAVEWFHGRNRRFGALVARPA
jgi:undecaprenyl diphosphate synthase